MVSSGRTPASGPTNCEEGSRAPVLAFALLSPAVDPLPSTRIACLNLFAHLREAGFAPEVRWEPASPKEVPTAITEAAFLRDPLPDLVVFQKIRGPCVVAVVRALRERGIRCVYCVCDIVDNDMVAETNATLAVTDYLRSLYAPELRHRIHVVHDGVENESLVATAVATSTARPCALLVTSQEMNAIPVISVPPSPWRVRILGRYPPTIGGRLQRIYWSLRQSHSPTWTRELQAICHPRIERHGWSQSALHTAMAQVQVGIIPVDRDDTHPAKGTSQPVWRVKSENRLTLLMAAGLPVVASRIPAYENVIVDGVNGFFAESGADWRRCLDALRDPTLRFDVGRRARATVLPTFSQAAQAERFVSAVRSVLS